MAMTHHEEHQADEIIIKIDSDVSSTHPKAFTSTPCSPIHKIVSTNEPVHIGNTVSRTKLIGCSFEKAYLTSPMLPMAVAERRSKRGTGKWNVE